MMSDTEVAQPVLTEGTCRVDQELFNHKSWKLHESHKKSVQYHIYHGQNFGIFKVSEA